MRGPEKAPPNYHQALVVRLGEALGPQWQSVDIDLGSLVIRRTL